ncbi:MAG: hypothetical protein WAK45_04970 [Methanoregula sp.]
MIILLIVFVCSAVVLCGCTSSQPSSSTSTPGTSSTSGATAPTSTLTTTPTDVMPSDQAVTVTVGEKDYHGDIPVTFNGGFGQGNVNSIKVVLTRVDGTTDTETLGSNAGTIVNLVGTPGNGTYAGESDRVEVYVTMNNGQTYKVADVLKQYRSRGGSGE